MNLVGDSYSFKSTSLFFQCTFCPKAFVNNSFLQSHLARRHPDLTPSHFDQSAQPIQVAPVATAPAQIPTPQPDMSQVGRVTQKGPLWPESLSYQLIEKKNKIK